MQRAPQEILHPIPLVVGSPTLSQEATGRPCLGYPEEGREPLLNSSLPLSLQRNAALQISQGVEGSYVRLCHFLGHILLGQDTVSQLQKSQCAAQQHLVKLDSHHLI